MTAAEAGRLPKYARVAAAIRRQIADGTLRPGQPAPSGAELSRATGFSTLTCRKALRTLIADGILVPGPSPNARPRVADPHARGDERDLAEATRALSAGLAAARHAAGLTQVELAALTGISVTTVGHAETGRTWQSRRFWERADTALCASGALLRLHDAYRAAGSAHQEQRSNADSMERTVVLPRPATAPPPLAGRPGVDGTAWVDVAAVDAAGVDVVRVDAAGVDAVRVDAAGVDAVRVDAAGVDVARVDAAAMDVAGADEAAVGGQRGLGYPTMADPTVANPTVATQPDAPVQAVPSRIMIVWTDGTVTTVHPPSHPPHPLPGSQASSARAASAQAPSPQASRARESQS